MDAPPGKGDDPADFLKISDHLHRLHLSAPQAIAKDTANGFLLLEDFGDGVFARLVANDPNQELPLYKAAVETLLHLQRHAAPAGLPDLSAKDWAEAAMFAPRFYAAAILGQEPNHAPLQTAVETALRRHADGPRVLILRDFHAENLIWLPRRQHLRRVGLLDFQLGQMGQPAYDLVSLLQDARRDVSAETETALCAMFGQDDPGFAAAYAVLGAQRALRIIGIFARLCLHGGKPGYLPLIPRVWAHLQRNLAHPALSDVAKASAILPPPTEENLQRIARQCARHP
ncbi:aminoglycoside phosphotransferase [Gemmobacter tilapiae]|uniref:Aminoglycoside phosphotransferase n=2 Tax=Neogemmobacter tilapiae TaxID=875041 RepID=A0A918TPW3_9RHOB|nr:aminoglycoside phosphotransferase [Gemmobacter tilapiae]